MVAVRERAAGVEREDAVVARLGGQPVPFVPERHRRRDAVGLRQAIVERERPLTGGLRLRPRLGGRREVEVAEHGEDQPDSRVCLGKPRVAREGVLEAAPAPSGAGRAAAWRGSRAPSGRGCTPRGRRSTAAGARRARRRERDLQLLDDRQRELVLDGEDVPGVAVEPLRPQVEAVGHADQLRRDAQPAARGTHAALEHGVDVQDPADLADVEPLVLERERRRAGDDPQPLDAARGRGSAPRRCPRRRTPGSGPGSCPRTAAPRPTAASGRAVAHDSDAACLEVDAPAGRRAGSPRPGSGGGGPSAGTGRRRPPRAAGRRASGP